MKLRKKIYIYAKGFIYGVLTAPINAMAWIYCNAIKWTKEEILEEEWKEKNK
jgi:malate/lactate dehydrogenase